MLIAAKAIPVFVESESSQILEIQESDDKRLVVVGGGAAGVFAAIRAKDVCPQLQVLVLEKGRPLSKVKCQRICEILMYSVFVDSVSCSTWCHLLSQVRISGGGRCNVTTALFDDPLVVTIIACIKLRFLCTSPS